MLRDDHLDYDWFFAFPQTEAPNAATAITEWCSAFGVLNCLMSDSPTHFKNETVRLVCKGLKVPHHFTLPYYPRRNGVVERLGRELFRVFRSVLSELQILPLEWPDLLPIVQSMLNNTPCPQRGNISPITSFLGSEPSTPVSTFIRTSTTKPVTVMELQQERVLNIDDLLKRCADLHLILQTQLFKPRSRKIASLPARPLHVSNSQTLQKEIMF